MANNSLFRLSVIQSSPFIPKPQTWTQTRISDIFPSTSSKVVRETMLLHWILPLSLLTAVQAILVERQLTTPTTTTSAVNCSIQPTVCYLSNPYPIALHPGLNCTVSPPSSSLINSTTFNVFQITVPPPKDVVFLHSAEIVSPSTTAIPGTAQIQFVRFASSDYVADVSSIENV